LILIVLALFVIVLFVLPFLVPLPDTGVEASTLAIDGGRFITVDGLQTYIVERGPTDGIPVVLLHGVFGSTYTWRNQLDVLAANGYRAIAFDRPGSGLTDKLGSTNYSHASQADFLAALLDTLNIPTVVLVGHSSGGNVLAHFALRHTNRVDRLVIVDGAIVGQSGPPAFIGRLVAFSPVSWWIQIGLRVFFNQKRLADSLRSMYADPETATPETIAAYWRAFQTKGWETAFIGLTRDGATNRLTDAQMKSISVPTCLLWGERDTWTPLAQAERLRSLLPNVAAFAVISGSGHQPMEEAPTRFNEHLLAFLGQLEE
jgi:pimeloyl-ACP methyl ester carboxylesterase